MNTLDAIISRRSVRKYTEQKISEEDLHDILRSSLMMRKRREIGLSTAAEPAA